MRFKTYFKYWLISSILSVQTALENRTAAIFFLTGKFLRFILFLAFLSILDRQIDQIGGFSLQQMITFFLVFNLLDLFGQIFFRGIYWFRQQVVSGEFDFRLTKPLNSLFQALTRQTDVLDLPLFFTVIIMLSSQPFSPSPLDAIISIVLFISAAIIITAIHIIVASLGVITTEVDHTIMIYRDLSNMARFPIDIYADALRTLLTFVIPIGIAYTFPAKALIGLLNVNTAIYTLIFATTIFIASLKLWQYALTQYSSASS